jgi:hypothetical protein
MVALFLFLKGMTGVLAPFSYLVQGRIEVCFSAITDWVKYSTHLENARSSLQ